ncbi:MAG: tetratricopeptide repeat protein [Clostridia bacterium]
MIVDKFIIIVVLSLLIICLSIRFIKRYAPENLIIISLNALSIGIYIPFALNNIYIPIVYQIFIMTLGFLIPLSALFLQYNDIILTRRLLYYLMKCAYFSKEYQKTIEYITKIVSIQGRKAEYLYILGQCYKNLNDFMNSRDSFALAIELDKNDYKSYYELGLVLDETNKKDRAKEMFEAALKIKPDFYDAQEALGICLTSQGCFRDAANVYKKALFYHPDSYELYYNIAMIEMELGQYEDAEQAFLKAGEIKPDLYTTFYNIGSINYLKGEYDKAIEAYQKILCSSLYGPKAYYKIALVYAAKAEYEKSMSSLEYAMELDNKYIKKAVEENSFKKMRDRINEYITDKELMEQKIKNKKNFMKDRILKFKQSILNKGDNLNNLSGESENSVVEESIKLPIKEKKTSFKDLTLDSYVDSGEKEIKVSFYRK